MRTVLIMAERYQTRPSEIAGIYDPYLAFQFDECCAILEDKCTDSKGNRNYDRLSANRGENEFLEFAMKHGRRTGGVK